MRETVNIRWLDRKARKCEVERTGSKTFRVTSTSGRVYEVEMGGTCQCDWAYYGGRGCSHQLAAIKFWLQEQGWERVSFWPTEADAKRQHRHIAKWNQIYVTGKVGARC